jgi:hypothetical protein
VKSVSKILRSFVTYTGQVTDFVLKKGAVVKINNKLGSGDHLRRGKGPNSDPKLGSQTNRKIQLAPSILSLKVISE